jgi:uncharacterized OsmC-like protein
MTEYEITARRANGHSGEARARSVVIQLDTAREGRADALSAAELLLASVGAAVLTETEQAATAMSFPIASASVQVRGVHRSDASQAQTVGYVLTVGTDEPEHRLMQLHERVWRAVNLVPLGAGAQLTGGIRRAPSS